MTAGRRVLLAFHIQHALISWVFGGLLFIFGRLRNARWVHGVLTGTRPEKATRSLAFLRLVGFTAPGRAKRRMQRHEIGVHVAQSEDLAFAGFWVGALLAASLWALSCWIALPVWVPLIFWEATWLLLPAILVLEYLTAPLRFGVPPGEGNWLLRCYQVGATQSQHERSAYAQTADPVWWEMHSLRAVRR